MKIVTEKKQNGYDIFVEFPPMRSLKLVGYFDMDVDGFYKWWPQQPVNGYLDSDFMQLIVDKLNELNAEYKEQLEKDMATWNRFPNDFDDKF